MSASSESDKKVISIVKEDGIFADNVAVWPEQEDPFSHESLSLPSDPFTNDVDGPVLEEDPFSDIDPFETKNMTLSTDPFASIGENAVDISLETTEDAKLSKSPTTVNSADNDRLIGEGNEDPPVGTSSKNNPVELMTVDGDGGLSAAGEGVVRETVGPVTSVGDGATLLSQFNEAGESQSSDDCSSVAPPSCPPPALPPEVIATLVTEYTMSATITSRTQTRIPPPAIPARRPPCNSSLPTSPISNNVTQPTLPPVPMRVKDKLRISTADSEDERNSPCEPPTSPPPSLPPPQLPQRPVTEPPKIPERKQL